MKKVFLSLMLSFFMMSGYCQATYYWVGGLASASWTTAASWNTAIDGSGSNRSTPNYGDTLIFDGSNLGGAVPVTGAALINNIKTDTIASLRLQNGANITFINSHAANAVLAGTWGRVVAVTTVAVNTTNGSNLFACSNTSNVKVGAVITAPTTSVVGGITVVTSINPNVSFTTNLPALTTATGTNLTVCQPNTWTGDGSVLNIGDVVCTGTNSSIEQIISKVDNSNFFCVGTGQPQQAVTAVTTMKKVTPLTLTSTVNALYVSANSTLTFHNASSSRPLILFLAPGAKGAVEGVIELDLNSNTYNTGRIYVAPTGGAQLVFKSGSVFKSGELQYPFGAIANEENNNVLFEAGSQAWYGLAAGTPVNCIFGANYPQSVVKFNRGSLYVHNGGGDRFTGYTYREFPNVTSNVDLTIFQPGIVDSVIIPSGRTITQSTNNMIAIKGSFNNNGTFGFGSASAGPLLAFIGDGSIVQGLDLKGSNGTGVVNYNVTSPALGGSFQRIIVGVDAKLNLQNGANVQTYGQTTVYGSLNFGGNVITNQGTSGTSLLAKAAYTAPTVSTLYAATKSNTIVVDSVTNFLQGMLISGAGIPANTYIVTSASAGKILLLSNPVTVTAGQTVTATSNPNGATLITSNSNGIAGSYSLSGTSTYSLPTGTPGINYQFDGATTAPFPPVASVFIRDLTLNSNTTSNVTELKISNTLNLNGNTLTVPASDTVRIMSGNAITGASDTKYVVLESNPSTGARGFLRMSNLNAATLFPIGTASSYLPLTITPAASNEDYSVNAFTGRTEDGMPNGTPSSASAKDNSVDAVWTINNNFTPASTSTLQFGWPSALEGSSFSGLANNRVGITQYNSGWGQGAGTGDNTANTASKGFNTFGAFIVNEALVTLPVKFSGISIKRISNKQCIVNWQNVTEIDILLYNIESSKDGVHFTSIGTVNANGNKQYSFTDHDMQNGVNYYRVNAIGMNGLNTYSTIVNSRFLSTGVLNVFPNPVKNGALSISVNNKIAGQSELTLRDIVGRIVFISKLDLAKGGSTYSLNLPSNIKAGIYQITLVSSDGSKDVKSIAIQ